MINFRTFYSKLKPYGRFYIVSFVIWLVWVVALDENNVSVVRHNYLKLKDLEEQKKYYQEMIIQVKEEREEVFGNQRLIEKWAREKYYMRKANEDVYIMVDENGKSIEE